MSGNLVTYRSLEEALTSAGFKYKGIMKNDVFKRQLRVIILEEKNALRRQYGYDLVKTIESKGSQVEAYYDELKKRVCSKIRIRDWKFLDVKKIMEDYDRQIAQLKNDRDGYLVGAGLEAVGFIPVGGAVAKGAEKYAKRGSKYVKKAAKAYDNFYKKTTVTVTMKTRHTNMGRVVNGNFMDLRYSKNSKIDVFSLDPAQAAFEFGTEKAAEAKFGKDIQTFNGYEFMPGWLDFATDFIPVVGTGKALGNLAGNAMLAYISDKTADSVKKSREDVAARTRKFNSEVKEALCRAFQTYSGRTIERMLGLN